MQWQEVKGRRNKRAGHKAAEEEQSAETTCVKLDDSFSRTQPIFFKSPTEWEILVQNTFLSVRLYDRSSRTSLSAPARLVTSGGSSSSTCRISTSSSPARPRLPATFPVAHADIPPHPPVQRNPQFAEEASEHEDDVDAETLGYMTVVRKRKGRNNGSRKLLVPEVASHNASRRSSSDLAMAVSPASSITSEEEEDAEPDAKQCEELKQQDNDDSDTDIENGKPELSDVDRTSPPSSHADSVSTDSTHLELKNEDDFTLIKVEAEATPSPSSPSSSKSAARRARKKAANAAAKLAEASANLQQAENCDAPAITVDPSPQSSVAAFLRMVALASPINGLLDERSCLEGSRCRAWPSRRPRREVPSFEVIAPCCTENSVGRTLSAPSFSRLLRCSSDDGAVRLEQHQQRLAKLHQAKCEVAEQQQRSGFSSNAELMHELEDCIKEAEAAVRKEQESLAQEAEDRKKICPAGVTATSPHIVFSNRGGAASSSLSTLAAASVAEGEATPCTDFSDAVVLVTQRLAQEKALSGLACTEMPSPKKL